MVLKSRETLGRRGTGHSWQEKQPLRGPGAWQVPREEPVEAAGGMPSAVGRAPRWSSPCSGLLET